MRQWKKLWFLWCSVKNCELRCSQNLLIQAKQNLLIQVLFSESSTTEFQPWVCTVIAAWRSLLFYWNWTVENLFRVFQNIFFIFCWSQSSCLLLLLFFVYPVYPKVSFITRWKMQVKAYRLFSLSTAWAGKLGKTVFLCHCCTFSSYLWPIIIYFSLSSHLHHCHFPSV